MVWICSGAQILPASLKLNGTFANGMFFFACLLLFLVFGRSLFVFVCLLVCLSVCPSVFSNRHVLYKYC